MLKREGADVNTFASSIRLQRKLEQQGLNEEQIESFVENIDIHCFKHGLKPEQKSGYEISVHTNYNQPHGIGEEILKHLIEKK